jgi:hypothetical protein
MTLEERVAKIERHLGAQDPMVRELRDAVTVTAQLEARQSQALKEHTEFLVQHEKWLREHEISMRDHDRRMTSLDERISALVSGMGEFMRRERNA